MNHLNLKYMDVVGKRIKRKKLFIQTRSRKIWDWPNPTQKTGL